MRYALIAAAAAFVGWCVWASRPFTEEEADAHDEFIRTEVLPWITRTS